MMELTQTGQLILLALISAIATLFLRPLVLRLSRVIFRIFALATDLFFEYRFFERNYRRYLIEKESRLPSQGIPTQSHFALDLHEIFVDPRLIPSVATELSSTNFGEVIDSFNRIVILGDPGTGKTTLLKLFAVNAARGTKQLPLYIPLRQMVITLPFPSLESYLTQLPFTSKLSQAFFQRKLQKGGWLILLDGLDEVQESDRMEIVNWIHHLAAFYPNNVFVVSSRTTGYTTPLQGFDTFLLAGFNHEEILAYVRNWTLGVQLRIQSDTDDARANAEERAQELVRIIESNISIHELARNPLFLTIILSTYYNFAALPAQPGVLLNEVTRAMLENWDHARGLIQHQFSLSAKRKFLGIIAFAVQEQEAKELKRNDVERLLSESFSSVGLEADQVTDFLNEIITRTGLLVELEPSYLAFSHLIFQEYLAATELVRLGHGLELISGHVDDDHWQAIIILYAGLLPDATKVVKVILEKREPASSRYLILAGKCLANAVSVETSLRRHVIEALKRVPESDPSSHDQALSLLNTVDRGGL